MIVAAGMLALASCGVTRRIPEGQYLLTRYSIEEDKQTPKHERIKADELHRFVQPQPNRRFLGTNLYIRLHNMANPDTTNKNWWNRTLRKLGEAPVLLDTTLARQSAEYMRNYTTFSGFYHSEVTCRIDTTRRKKARVVYSVRQGTPYRIGEISYEFRDEFLRPIIMNDSASTLLATGNVLDGNVLTRERSRIVDYLRNNGYYKFNLNNLEFQGDSTVGGYRVDLNVVFKQHLAGYDDRGTPLYENNSIYRISDITINPEYDPMTAVSDPSLFRNMDTISYRGLNVLHRPGIRPKVKPKVLRRAVEVYPNYLYNASEVQRSSSNILRLGFYKNTNIVFRELEADTTMHNQVTYIGDDDATETTTERYMSCHINSIPTLRHGYKIELEGTTSSNFNAITASVGYHNRNLLRGVEQFDITLRGGYEFTRSKESKGSFEIGGATSLSFPRFLVPFRVDRFNRAVNPRTRVELSISSQRRPYYHRVISGANWGYSWGGKKGSSYTLRPIDLNLIKMNSLDTLSDFWKSIHSEYLKESYKEQLAGGISGTYVYNSQLASRGSKTFLLRFNWETAGNLFSLIAHTFEIPSSYDGDKKIYEIFGIPFAQYARFDISLSDRFVFGPKTSLAWRLMGGIGFSYGNGTTIPYDRLFYSGGSNSMRGWLARTLGPGTVIPSADQRRYNNQVGSMKLEANTEFRFPIWGLLNGAVFVDVGNVWFLREDKREEEAIFKFDRFLSQLGFNTGVGVRFDIGMAVLRFDWGMRLHNPNRDKGDRWTSGFDFLSDSVLNFGVGYPF